jgi:hypothetical protein
VNRSPTFTSSYHLPSNMRDLPVNANSSAALAYTRTAASHGECP